MSPGTSRRIAFARAVRLPEAAGPRAGASGRGPVLRLLILGDSSAAGVGVARQDEALAGRLVAELAGERTVHWRLVARSGATTAAALRLLEAQAPGAVDAVVTALGVNDALRLTPVWLWRRRQRALVGSLRGLGARVICLSGVPPMGVAPGLPAGVRGLLGWHAARLDRALSGLASARDGVHHLPFAALSPSGPAPADWLARDGLHPNAALYADWAAHVAGVLRAGLAQVPPRG